MDRRLKLKFLESMLRIRKFEEKTIQLYQKNRIWGHLHPYIGQEAVAAGAMAAIDLVTDYVYTAYRDHGHAIVAGSDPNALMAELYGKRDGISRGKGGSMHFFDKERHFMGGNGIVGAHIPLAAGTALKIRNHNEKGAVLCFFGDGAIHQGSFHEIISVISGVVSFEFEGRHPVVIVLYKGASLCCRAISMFVVEGLSLTYRKPHVTARPEPPVGILKDVIMRTLNCYTFLPDHIIWVNNG